MTKFMALLKNRTVQQLFIYTVFQNILWWVAGSTAATGTPLPTLVKFYLLVYGGFLAAGSFLILNRHFQSAIGPILVVAAATMGFLAAPDNRLIQLFALLICIFLVLVCVPQLGLQSVYGLIVFSALSGCGVPVILFYLRNHYLAWQFMLPLLPIIFSYLAFYEFHFIPQAWDWRLTLITPALLIVTILITQAFSWQIAIASLLVAGYGWLQRRINARYRLVTTSVVQLILGLLVLD